jgi:hypothetical protein
MTVRELRPGPPKTRRRQLLEDPNLTGNLLLVALVLDQLIAEGKRPIRMGKVAELTGLGGGMRRILLDDVPRYQPPPRPGKCQVRGPRNGQCPRYASTVVALPDPEDGTTTWAAGCALTTHSTWATAEQRRHREALGDSVPPLPVYNTRSVLAASFPEIDFPEWWTRLTERDEWRRYDVNRDPMFGAGDVVLQRPKLRVVG